jgi:hypothetical protein
MTFASIRSNPAALNIFSRNLFRSSAYAVAAYFYAVTLEKLLMIAGAAISGYDITLDYQDVGVIADPSAWYQESVLLIYLFPYLIQAMLVVLIYINQQRVQSNPGYTMIFLQWVMFFVTFRLTGMIPVHLFFKTGVYHAFNWLYLGGAFKVIISIAGLVIFFIAGTWMLKGVMFFSSTFNNHYRVTGLPNIIRSSLLIPSFFACLVPGLFFLPGLPKDEIAGLAIVAIIAGYTILKLLYGRHESLPKGEAVTDKTNPKLLLAIVLVAVIVLRVVLGFDLQL